MPHYSIQPKDQIFVKVMDFCLLLKVCEKIFAGMLAEYQKLLDEAKKFATDALKTASKRAIQKTAETTGDLICNEIANKIKCYST